VNLAFPTAELAVMGPDGAVNIVFRNELKGADDPAAKRVELEASYRENFANPYKAAELGYIDEVIRPEETRPRIIRALEMLATKTILYLSGHSEIVALQYGTYMNLSVAFCIFSTIGRKSVSGRAVNTRLCFPPIGAAASIQLGTK
jgi:hypothetical protein